MRHIILALFTLALTGCSTMMEGMPGFTHTAALMLRQPQQQALSQAEHILTQPKDIRIYFEGQPDQIVARRYTFNNEYDVVLFFGKGMFLALDSMPPNSDKYPQLLRDFKSFKSESDLSLRGYIITKTASNLELKVTIK